MTKRMFLSLVLAITMVVTFAVPTFAASTTHNFICEYDETKGSVEFSVPNATKGTYVTCYITPERGYLVDEVTVTNVTTETAVSHKTTADNISFTMPDSDVKIEITFEEADGAYATRLYYDEDLGYVELSKNGADYTDYVSIFVDPDSGVTIDSVKVINSNTDKNVTVTKEGKTNGVTKYEFKMPKADVEIYVVFDDGEDDDDEDGEYYVDIDFNSSRGDAWTTADYADSGVIVKIYTDPDNGYYVKSISINDGDVRCFEASDYYYFVMPDDDVDIYVTFSVGSGSTSTSSGKYDIIIEDYDDSYGEIWIEDDSADYFDTVRIDYDVADGVEIDEILVYDDEDELIDVSFNNVFYYFRMPRSDVRIEVYFSGEPEEDYNSDDEYDITLIYDDAYGDVRTNKTDDVAEYKDTVRIYVYPDDDCEVESVIVKKSNGSSVTVKESASYYSFTMPSSDVKVTVIFSDEDGTSSSSSSSTSYYDIDVDYDSDWGDVDIDNEGKSGKKIEFTVDGDVEDIRVIRLSDGKQITVKEGSDDGEYYFTMPSSDVYVDVLFYEDLAGNDYDIELDFKSSRGDVELSNDEADEDDKVKIYIEPTSGYEVDTVKVYKGSKKVTVRYINDYCYYFTMPDGDVEVSVTFAAAAGDYEIKTSYTSTQGTVTVSPTTADSGDTVDVTVTPKTGYKIKSVTAKRSTGTAVTLSEEGNGIYSFVMPAYDVTVTATFEANVVEYTITNISDASFGTVAVAAKSEKSKTVTVTPTPKSGYTVNTVSVTDASGKAVSVTKGTSAWTFVMPASDVKVNVTFKQAAVDYFVTTTYNKDQGTVTVTPTKSTATGKITVTPTANTGYVVESVTAVNTSTNAQLAITKSNDTYTFTMPAANAKVTVTFKEGVHNCPSAAFTDIVTTEWYHEAVDYVVTNKIMNGMSDTAFAPAGTTTRAMVTTVLWRIAGSPVSTAAMPYTDVVAGQWYTEAIRWAAADGILTNVSNTSVFEPDATITREQFATMIYRFEQYKAGGNLAKANDQISKFSDKASVSEWAVDAFNWCGANGIINGNANGTLDPQGSTTRAQLAQILYNYRSFN